MKKERKVWVQKELIYAEETEGKEESKMCMCRAGKGPGER